MGLSVERSLSVHQSWRTTVFSFFKSKPPPVPPWEVMPSLSICVFGPVDAAPAVSTIVAAARQYLCRYYAVDDDGGDDITELVDEKVQTISIAELSEMGMSDRPSRLASTIWEISGQIGLLLEAGATTTDGDAQKVLNVLGEFVGDPKLVVLQGKGYHAFVRTEALRALEFCREGPLCDSCKRWGVRGRRVNYVCIDDRRNRAYEL